jgi:hypothetical protein
MANNKQPRGFWQNVQLLALVGVIVGFPLVSFLVNMKGAEAGRNFYSELKQNLGKIPTFSLNNSTNETITSETYKGKVRVASWTTDVSRDSVLSVLNSLLMTPQLSEDVDNLQFLTFDVSTDSTKTALFQQQLPAKRRPYLQILRGGKDLSAAIKLPNDFSFALLDTAGTIRRFYDIREGKERTKLVEHISASYIRRKKNVEKRDQKDL